MKAFWLVFLSAYGVAWLLLIFACFAWEAWKLFFKEVRNAQSGARTHSPSNVPTDPQRVHPTIEQSAAKGKEESR